jgi:WD40 repeat protein
MAGHLNSIKDLAFSPLLGEGDSLATQGTALYLASGSQDQNIRIWKVQQLQNMDSVELKEDDWKKYQTKTSFVIQVPKEPRFNVTLESVIVHHGEAVSSVEWRKTSENTPTLSDLVLLSSSFDFTVCVWQADPETEAWHVQSTLGAMVGNKHAFFGAIFLSTPRQILAYTYGGAMH